MPPKNTPGVGSEYEVLIPAYFALKLNTKGIEDFQIQSNVENMGKFDDVVIDVTKKETKVSFAIQLKHKENKNKQLLPGDLEADKGDFSLKTYWESFKGLSDVNKQRQFILYTNVKFDPKRTEEMTNFTMIQDDRYDGNIFFNSDEGNVYKFEVNDKTLQNGNITPKDEKKKERRRREFFFHDLDFSFVRKILKILNKPSSRFWKKKSTNIWLGSENGIMENIEIKKLTKRR
jgi:hypothetical protein